MKIVYAFLIIGVLTSQSVAAELPCPTVGQVGLKWTYDPGTEPTSANIERAFTSTGPFTVIGTVGTGVTQYIDTTIPPTTPVVYYIERDANGYSNAIGCVPQFVVTPPPPPPPTGPTVDEQLAAIQAATTQIEAVLQLMQGQLTDLQAWKDQIRKALQ